MVQWLWKTQFLTKLNIYLLYDPAIWFLDVNTRKHSVQFSCSVVSDSLWPHELQHARPPCLKPTLGVHSNSCPSSRWCHPAISSSVVPFSSCPQSLPASVFSNENSSHEVAKVLEFQLYHQSFQWTPRTNLLQDGLVGSPCRIWEVFSFESSFILGKTLLNSIACYREIICEMQGQLLQQTSLLSY